LTPYQDLLELMRRRRSVRRFAPRGLDRAQIEQLLEAARWAPSNHNRQGWKFLVFQDPDRLKDLAGQVQQELWERLNRQTSLPQDRAEELLQHATLFAQAPVVLLVLHKKPVAIGKRMLSDLQGGQRISGEALSAAMAVQNLLLAAEALNLGACVLTAPLLAQKPWQELPDLPPGHEPTCLVALGNPAEEPSCPRRKPIAHIVEYR
jgi:nitroreductase